MPKPNPNVHPELDRGVVLLPDVTDAGRPIAVAYTRHGVEVARAIVPDDSLAPSVREHLVALLNLHDPPLRAL